MERAALAMDIRGLKKDHRTSEALDDQEEGINWTKADKTQLNLKHLPEI
jgi:hypothetical protein